MIKTKQIHDTTQISITNELFKLFGRTIPQYDGKQWSYSEQLYEEADITEMCFPEEYYQSDRIITLQPAAFI
ncbi:hypothetical protein [Macrococcus brunensis]|uniref:hypothetical protein n=1 Tax=Macrococcus brunensis TaxID=198483 RepID=UPI001EF08E4A|nr:hypothetical protein [Macrococcus brunensis]ULG72204.1 hypothetical protein MGG12_01365 [Macrococcus brunensis]